MKNLFLICLAIFFCAQFVIAGTIVIKNVGQTYSPSTITARVGDTIDFQLQSFHNSVEVTKTTWDAAGNTSNGGFTVPFGGGKVVVTKVSKIYFVCTPHASAGMKGTINVIAPNIVIKNSGQTFTPNTVNARVGDTIDFQLQSFHNALEVSKSVWDAGGSTSNGGFLVPFGGGKVALTKVGTLYYVCEPHAQFGMKGIINVAEQKIGDTYIAKLSGVQEEFPFAGFGSGEIKAVLIDDSLTVTGSFKNLSGEWNGGAHLHQGLAGISGPVRFNLNVTADSIKKSGTISNKFFMTQDQKALLASRSYYANIHTNLSPSGEIRGQLVPESDAYYQVNLMGSHEVPVVMTSARGALVGELIGTNLVISGSVKELGSGINTGIRMGGHLHLGFPGQNGGIQLELKPILDSSGSSATYTAADNTFTLTPAQLAALKASQLYANIHTNQFGGGEIRGQVTPMSTAKFRVNFSGAFEAVPVTTQASGGLIATLIDSTLSVVGSFAGLESNLATNVNGGAHIHRGMAGQNGGIQLVLKSTTGADSRSGIFAGDSNSFKLTGALLDDLFARRLYGNVHSANFAGGEIRGQLLPESQFFLFGYFSGMQENKPLITTGKGNVIAEINGTKLTLTGYAEALLDKANRSGIAHLHKGPTGTNGPVTIPLSVSFLNTDSLSLIFPAIPNTYTISTGLIDTLKRRGIYANIHTAKAPGGEIRAQLNAESAAYFHSIMSGASENPAILTKGVGGLMAELPAGSSGSVIVHGSFSGLEGKFNPTIAGGSHIHGGIAGTNGGIRTNIVPVLNADSTAGVFLPANNMLTFTAGGIDSLRRRFLYSNIHTTKSAGGEIRGNFLNLANAYFTSTINGLNEVPPLGGQGNGAVKAELVGTRLTVTGSFAGLTGDFNRSIAGGAHLHNGANGVNGGVLISLKTATNPDNKGGMFVADSNSFVLTADQLALVNSGGLYVNIHTTTSAGGEIRGQLLPDPNNFPTIATITSPSPTDTIKVDLKFKDSTATMTWTAATDPDGNAIVYKLQTSIFPDFSLSNLSIIGNATIFKTTYKSIDSTLAAVGILPGGSVTTYNRIIVSDGSLNIAGGVSNIIFQRGLTTDVRDAFIKSFSIAVFPVPAAHTAILEINAAKPTALDMQIVDISGRLVISDKLQVTQGINQFRVDISNLSAGTHFIQLYQKGQQVAYLKMIKE